MYRKYLDSEITFDELIDWVAGLVGPISSTGESSRDAHWDLSIDVKMPEPVPRDHHVGDSQFTPRGLPICLISDA